MKIIRNFFFSLDKILNPRIDGAEADRIIIEYLLSDNPCMIARLGAVESKAIIYGKKMFPLSAFLKKYTYDHMHRNAGFFPIDEHSIGLFSNTMLSAMTKCDVLGSWRPEEYLFRKELKCSVKIALGVIGGPHDTKGTWFSALRGKKILVVHPFAESIKKQYLNRTKLFTNEDALPEFESLQTIKAIQTIAGNDSGFRSWFEALEYMKKEIDKCDFDICLLGCGAYGFPLAAYIKEKGKKAVHIGGPLQLHFGIKGKRWDNRGLYNDYWISPSDSERPNNLSKVENGCYW